MEGHLQLGPGSAGAGARLYWKAWLPDGPLRAIALLAHGYAEHLERYADFARALNGRGIGLYAIDHWGHGKSEGRYGFVPAFSAYTDGMEALLAEAEQRHPAVPRFLIGHSMGGLIAAAHLISHQAHYSGAVLSGPAIKAAQDPSRLMVWISRLLSRLAPKMGVLALESEAISRDPAVVAAYQGDPLVYHGKMSARLAAEMFETMAAVRAQSAAITLPILLLHGEKDRLTAKSGSKYLDQHVGSLDKRLVIYPGLYHEIFNEPERDSVIADVTGWIEARCP